MLKWWELECGQKLYNVLDGSDGSIVREYIVRYKFKNYVIVECDDEYFQIDNNTSYLFKLIS